MFQQKRFVMLGGAAAMAALLSACGTPPTTYGANNYPVGNVPPGYTTVQPAFVEYGRVANIELIQSTSTMGAAPSNSGNTGSVVGAIVGGVLGNTIGHGGGRAAATVLGAVGGAVIGNKLARNNDGTYQSSTGYVYRVSVQADNGEWRSYDVSSTGDLRVGDRVRIENNVLYRS